MNKFFLNFFLSLLVCLAISCNSSSKPYKQKTELSDDIISTVNVEFEFNNNGWDTKIHSSTLEFAYLKLLEIVKNEYGSGFGVKNINVTLIKPPYPQHGRIAIFYATGVVVIIKDSSGNGLEDAISRAVEEIITGLPKDQIIAIINIATDRNELSAYAVDEIEFKLVSSKITVVDRQTLDRIRSEQNFQLSGEVNDDSAVSIGQLLGANVVLTGSITETAKVKRISIRALDVQTAQIIKMARETFY